MQGTYWLTVLPETSRLRPMIKKALRGVDDDAKITPRVDAKEAGASGRAYGDKFAAGFERSRASKLGAMFGAMGAGFKTATAGSVGLIRNIGMIATVTKVASRGAKMLSLSLLGAAGGMRVLAGIGLGKVAIGLGFAAKQAGQLARAVGRATAALLVLAGVAKVLGVMNRFSKIAAGLTIGLSALLGVTAALASVTGQALVSALMAVGAAGGVAAGALVGLLGPAIATAKIAFKGLEEGAKAFTESMKDVWGPADEAFNKMIGQRMGPMLTSFRELKHAVTDVFSNALTPGMNAAGGLMDRLRPRFTALAGDLGALGSEVANALASPANAAALEKMFDASDQFFAKFLGESGISGAVGGLVQFAATAADTFKGVGGGINEQLLKFGEWLRGISPAQMLAAFGALKSVVMSVWNVLKPILVGIKDLGAVAAPALAPGVKALGEALGQAGPMLVQMAKIIMPALSAVMERLAPVIPALVQAFMPWAGVLAQIAPPLAGIVAHMAPLAPVIMGVVIAVKAIGTAMMISQAAMFAFSVGQGVAAAATGVGTAALAGNTIALGAHKAAMIASTIATRAFGITMAIATAPITLIIAAVAAIGVALWAFFTKTEVGRKMWSTIWTGIKTAVATVWAWLQPKLTQLGALLTQLWQKVQPAVAAFGRFYAALAKWQFNNVVTALKAVGAVISWLWQNVVTPAFGAIGAIIGAWWSTTQTVWGAAKTAIQAVGDVVMWLWNTVAVPAFNAIGAVIQTWWSGVQGVWDLFQAGVDKVGGAITTLKDAFSTGFNAIKGVVETVWNFISGILDKIRNGIGNVVDKLNSVPGLGALIPGAAGGGQAPGFAGGSAGVSRRGVISGPGTGTSDSILARVSHGEGIVTADAMANGGAGLVAALNAGWVPPADLLRAMLPGFAEGLVTAEQLVEFAKGVEGQPYKWGGVNWGDCSGAVSAIANYAVGQDPFGSRFATATEGSELEKRGFQPGLGPSGSLSIGWYNGGPGGGHTAATLPDGTNFEMGGSRGDGQFGGSAAGADAPSMTNQMHLPPEYFAGLDGRTGSTSGGASSLGAASSAGGSGTFRQATSKELSAGQNRVTSAGTTLKNANQRVDDATYARDKAQRRLDELRGEGKDTADAQHSLDVKNRELQDAIENQTQAKDKATKAEQDFATLQEKGVEDASAAKDSTTGGSGNPFDDLGKSLVGGLFESIGLDGSLFSNPFEWPTVKSAMAGVNFFGKLLSGTGAEGAEAMGPAAGGGGGGGDLLGGLLGAGTEMMGLDQFDAMLNPAAADIAAAPAGSAVAPDTTQHGAGGGAAPGAPGVYIENAGMAPVDVANKLDETWNARTRTTKVH